MADDGAELIELFPSKPGEESDRDAPLKRRGRDRGERYCGHTRVTLYEEARRVYCRDCGREVPAFDALTNLAAEWERYTMTRDRARADAKRAQERLEDVRRQEANAKSRLRTARKRLTKDDPVWAALDELLAVPHRYVTVDRLREILYG